MDRSTAKAQMTLVTFFYLGFRARDAGAVVSIV
jgi:hypothetical protein